VGNVGAERGIGARTELLVAAQVAQKVACHWARHAYIRLVLGITRISVDECLVGSAQVSMSNPLLSLFLDLLTLIKVGCLPIIFLVWVLLQMHQHILQFRLSSAKIGQKLASRKLSTVLFAGIRFMTAQEPPQDIYNCAKE